ncbi:MAG: hypothetical protein Q7W02_11745 [Candidatus Rokubacteria bacterium]|nr:hypothetical protein [Candidatus Rokubacteria bacterium]
MAEMDVPPNYGARYAADFRRLYAGVARTHKAAFMPFLLDEVAGNPRLNQPDGIHPTAEGYRIVVDHLWPHLKPMLTR